MIAQIVVYLNQKEVYGAITEAAKKYAEDSLGDDDTDYDADGIGADVDIDVDRDKCVTGARVIFNGTKQGKQNARDQTGRRL